MTVEWPGTVSAKFYGMTRSTEENSEEVKFESGKTRRYLRNSSPKKNFSVSVDLWSRQEERDFWEWYSETLLSRVNWVTLPDFTGSGESKDYEMTDEPSSEGQMPVVLTLSFREV